LKLKVTVALPTFNTIKNDRAIWITKGHRLEPLLLESARLDSKCPPRHKLAGVPERREIRSRDDSRRRDGIIDGNDAAAVLQPPRKGL